MVTILTAIQVLVALVLILVVLLQSAKGTDLAGAFGGMGSQTAFGPRGTTNFLSRTTTVLAAIFMVSSLSLAVLSNRVRHSNSVLSGEKAAPVSRQQQQPATPGQTGVQVATPNGIPTPSVQVIPAPAPAAPAAKNAPVGSRNATPPAQPAPAATAPPAEAAPSTTATPAEPSPATAAPPGK
jgi:preprotein translocase subunit SecG